MNIFLRELKANRKALIIWSVCMFLFVASGMAKFSAYTSGTTTGPSINDIMKTLPTSVKGFLGFGSFDVATMAGYFAVLVVYFELTVAIHAALLGAGMISKEERDKTTEFLMIKPVSRTTVITSKFLAALFNIVVVNVVTLLSSLALTPVYNKGKAITGEILAMMFIMFIVQLIFLSLGTVLAAFMKNPKGSGAIATGVILIAYFVARITDMFDKLNFLNVISPFKYLDLSKVVAGESLNIVIVILSVLLVGVFSALTYFFYNKRDLKI
jgi:ABC-2 type transport system permease protein